MFGTSITAGMRSLPFFACRHSIFSPDKIWNKLPVPVAIPLFRLVTTTGSFKDSLMKGRATYLSLHEQKNIEKIYKIFKHSFEETLRTFSIESSSHSLEENWALLQKFLNKNYSYELMNFDSGDMTQNFNSLLGMYQKPLIKKDQILSEFRLEDYIRTPSEFQWGHAVVSCPFTRRDDKAHFDPSKIQDLLDQAPSPTAFLESREKLTETEQKIQSYSLLNGERDAAAAILLATPHIHENTFIHEIGCWNGQTLLDLLFYVSLKNKTPKYCVGTDINSTALVIAESVSKLLKINSPFINFYMANGLDLFNPSCFGIDFENEIKLALRVIPVLNRANAGIFLKNVKKSFQSKKAILIVSYAIPQGKMYEQNKTRTEDRSQPQYTREDFLGGTTFHVKFPQLSILPKYLQTGDANIVLNTYYSTEAFSNLIEEAGFQIGHTISVKQDTDNERVVALLYPR